MLRSGLEARRRLATQLGFDRTEVKRRFVTIAQRCIVAPVAATVVGAAPFLENMVIVVATVRQAVKLVEVETRRLRLRRGETGLPCFGLLP